MDNLNKIILEQEENLGDIAEKQKETFLKRMIRTREINMRMSKSILDKYDINRNLSNSDIEEMSNQAIHGHTHKLDTHLQKATTMLKNKLDAINNNKIAKTVILSFIVYELNNLAFYMFYLPLKAVKFPGASQIATGITALIVSPITDEIASQISVEGGYTMSVKHRIGSKLILSFLDSAIFNNSAGAERLIGQITGIVLNTLHLTFKEEIHVPLVQNTLIKIKDLIHSCFSMFIGFFKIFGTLIPGGGEQRLIQK